MIRHIVVFNLKPEIDDAGREWLFNRMRSLSKIQSAKGLSLNRLLNPSEEWYKSRIYSEFEWAMTMEFEDEKGLYEYQKDPLHVEVAKEIRERSSNVKVMDFVSL